MKLAIDAWLPVGFLVPSGDVVRRAIFAGDDWQIFDTPGHARVLVARAMLADRWQALGLLSTPRHLSPFEFSGTKYQQLSSSPAHILAPVMGCRAPDTKEEALAFAASLKATRDLDGESPLHDAIYVERFSRLLPTFSLTPQIEDAVVLGTWLTGGVPVSVASHRRLRSLMGWLPGDYLDDVLTMAGFGATEPRGNVLTKTRTASNEHLTSEDQLAVAANTANDATHAPTEAPHTFALPGRPALEAFFNEHVIDIVQNREKYAALGVGFPSAIILHGPPGCGKTFAVERLIDYLGWPSYAVDASSIASPYIHETSRKVAEVFDQAMKHSPAVIVIDEMEAFLADRQSGQGSSHHRVEEVAEFLRRIPEATANQVLIIAMTNRIEMIDPAVLRRGRFDHIIGVGMASTEEIEAMLRKLLSDLPCEDDVDMHRVAEHLSDRPLSDIAFVVREGARLAAKEGKHKLDQASIEQAMRGTASRDGGDSPQRRMGFV
ncbi:MAG: ATP-binding protein [Burkholderiales bacterium]